MHHGASILETSFSHSLFRHVLDYFSIFLSSVLRNATHAVTTVHDVYDSRLDLTSIRRYIHEGRSIDAHDLRSLRIAMTAISACGVASRSQRAGTGCRRRVMGKEKGKGRWSTRASICLRRTITTLRIAHLTIQLSACGGRLVSLTGAG